MLKHRVLEPRFVKGVPRELEPGVLYVSIEYATAVHSCCCGCGLEVVTPITPTDWTLAFNGEQISLWPSVGNWNLPCKSHYVIDENKVIEAGPWPAWRIANAQSQERSAKKRFYSKKQDDAARSGPTAPLKIAPKSIWDRLWPIKR